MDVLGMHIFPMSIKLIFLLLEFIIWYVILFQVYIHLEDGINIIYLPSQFEKKFNKSCRLFLEVYIYFLNALKICIPVNFRKIILKIKFSQSRQEMFQVRMKYITTK